MFRWTYNIVLISYLTMGGAHATQFWMSFDPSNSTLIATVYYALLPIVAIRETIHVLKATAISLFKR